MKKIICVSLTFILAALSLGGSVVCAADNVSPSKHSTSVVEIDLSDITIDKKTVTAWNEGLVDALKSECANNNLNVKDLTGECTRFDKTLYEYGQKNCDKMSEYINEQLVSKAKSRNVVLDLNEKSEVYKQYIESYEIDDNTDITITPEAIYIDEFVEENTTPLKSDAIMAASTNATWKYKTVAARRTYYYKKTVSEKTYSFDIYSVHTGGQVKYNGTTAKHSADYHGYSLRRTYGELASFTRTSKLSEQYSGTSWHYKFAGKVSGKIKITTPISLSISLPEKILGCQVITTKSGNVTKKYWPSL